MQLAYSKGNPACNRLKLQAMAGRVVEKVLRDKEGKLVRAEFYLYEEAGRIKARLLNVSYIEEQVVLSGAIFSLPGYINTKLTWSEILPKTTIISPFISEEILYSSGSKPRAPTF